ncbi:DUF31 family protein [Ureaplasma zalophigenitalium]|uniref:DUF31 family protein n=1 Tax=Ureaplasma zalophigenitalium TaxID=907723 RepID=A0ABT3BNS0_9BACT|nr:DUF31 family protein [Ureaplasma zalophigenitalium]MCV3753902.1 DUF31 family protein [Ureaplasma zalophigenitalium]
MHNKKNRFRIPAILAAVGLAGFTSLSMVGCFWIKPYERTNKVITQAVFNNNRGFKNGYDHTLSLHFFRKNESQQTVDHTYGTGFILDFEPYSETSKLRTFYIATNIHVIAQVSDDVKSWSLSLGNTDLSTDSLHDTQAKYIQNSSSTLHGINLRSWDNKYSNQYEIFVIGDKTLSKYDNKASDIAVLRVQIDQSVFENLRVFQNFKQAAGISFSHLQNYKSVVGIGYPRLTQFTDLTFSEYDISDFRTHLLNANEQNYREDNPVQYYANHNLVKKTYSSYDVGLRNFNLGAGASGSLISDQDGNHLGIYWGGLEIKENNQKLFYGNFTPFFYKNKQNLLINYLTYLRGYQNAKHLYLPTYLQKHRQTNITISEEEFINLQNNYANHAIGEIIKLIQPYLIEDFNTFDAISEISLTDEPNYKTLLLVDQDHQQLIFKIHISINKKEP